MVYLCFMRSLYWHCYFFLFFAHLSLVESIPHASLLVKLNWCWSSATLFCILRRCKSFKSILCCFSFVRRLESFSFDEIQIRRLSIGCSQWCLSSRIRSLSIFWYYNLDRVEYNNRNNKNNKGWVWGPYTPKILALP